MLNATTHSQITVLDHDQALDFYVGKLGLEVRNDVQLEFMRWLTVAAPGDTTHEIILYVPGVPFDAATVEQIRDLGSKGALGTTIFSTDDVRRTAEQLRSRGVEFIQDVVEQSYAIDCAVRDPFGNHIRISQPAPVPAARPA
ncbi:VOC family protein [Conexibacter woesei]|uniref:Glyoxalase/bleomycin resistance protein/dioxygenase n=1 Tax=Conexibacter woesei (strain DSM 14684 / CCUG 47730 / CIP 108061 / JCM 11494 / NBRC 100937 / ID131577) TaxID=469383 RepID=D3FAG7_CONWI|nr:VOC family protein [Conexibacter woesei]ADB49236.1 Glyoxalase/bleomycin resistance protein/dioxygenase [Conexibacter woesei DSM 14684]